ncbi:hypothetical protein [Paenibacillus pinihumi]|uniref:hypothetical protein n=1 Tax=Paenibacillus pinihumi TaxID=669462 RepID=UPI000414F0C8|nr:hypothetical protein [Paenibacillus pinihumi]
MWKPALLLLAVLSIGGCGLSSYLPSMTDASPAVTVFVIQDVYGSPSVIRDVYTRENAVETLPPPPSGGALLEPYHPGERLRTQP